jgi:hypothetical protein
VQKIALKASNLVWTKLIGWPVEVLGKLPDCHQVRSFGSFYEKVVKVKADVAAILKFFPAADRG